VPGSTVGSRPAPIMAGVAFVLRNRNLSFFVAARFCSAMATMMFSVAVGWQVYALTHSAFALGMVGLAQFLPAFLLSLPGGLAADRFDRRSLLLASFGLVLLVGAALLGLALHPSPSPYAIFAVVAFLGVARAFMAPANGSLLPFLVPHADFARAVAWNSTVFQVATIAGPALGGILYAFGASVVYGTATGLLVLGFGFIASLRGGWHVPSPSTGWHGLLEGVRFVFAKKAILGAVSLDLFAVLFGGATALLPIFARDILHVGPWGLGILRSSPAVGAALVALWLAHHPIPGRAGRRMFACVAIFGLATIGFALSRSFWLSLVALVTLGGADMVSVVVRGTLVQVSTPDVMRGRVSAVNSMFIGASNELGEFESGLTAAWLGTVPATVLGGLGTLAVVAVWWRCFPTLRRADRLEQAVE
jgi:MFS family permease